MPRGSSSRRAQASRDTETLEQGETETVTTATDTVETETPVRPLPFELDITPAEEGYKPDRSPAGRRRIPSPFEPLLASYKGKGWQNQPHDGNVVPFDKAADGTPKFNTLSTSPKNADGTPSGIVASVADSNARIILRELQKAVKFLNTPVEKGGQDLNLGLDVNVTAELVQFNIRDKQKRTDPASTAPEGGDVTDGETADFGSDEPSISADSGDE